MRYTIVLAAITQNFTETSSVRWTLLPDYLALFLTSKWVRAAFAHDEW